MDYIQADSRARFSHCSTFTPLIKSHKGNNTSPQNVNWAIPLKVGKRKIVKELAVELITNGKTGVLDGFKSKTGKDFSAKLEIKDGEVKFEFS